MYGVDRRFSFSAVAAGACLAGDGRRAADDDGGSRDRESHHGRREKQTRELHGQGDPEKSAQGAKRHVEERGEPVRDSKPSAASVAAETRGFPAVVHFERDTPEGAEEEDAGTREDVLSRQGYRVFAPRTAVGKV